MKDSKAVLKVRELEARGRKVVAIVSVREEDGWLFFSWASSIHRDAIQALFRRLATETAEVVSLDPIKV